MAYGLCFDSPGDITWFSNERDKIFQIERLDHSIGTTSDSFFCSNSKSDITRFIVENDKLISSEPRGHSIGTILKMSFLVLNPMGIKIL